VTPLPGSGRADDGRLDGYRVLRRIAVGGMAELFLARAPDGREVVLKVLLPHLAAEPEFVELMGDEARLMERLEHPGLVRVYGHGRTERGPAIAMELVEGLSLGALLRHAGRSGAGLPVGVSLGIADRLLAALEHLHGLRDEQGRSLEVVHRDVTPGNVLLSRRGEVKLGDFGIARHRLRVARTRTGAIKGTVQYLSPEQLSGSGSDARTDLYGVGLLLFEMLTGAPFIRAASEPELLRVAQAPSWVAPSSMRAGLCPALDALLEPALRRFPEERYASAASFRAALRREAELEGIGRKDPEDRGSPVDGLAALVEEAEASSSAHTEGAGTVAPADEAGGKEPDEAPAPRMLRRRIAWVIPIAVLALLGGEVASWLSSQDESAPPEREADRAAGDPEAGAEASRRAPALEAQGEGTIDAASVEPAPVPQGTGPGPSAKVGPHPAHRTAKSASSADASPRVAGSTRDSRAPRPTSATVEEKLKAYARALSAKEILEEDLPTSTRAELARARRLSRQQEAEPALAILAELERGADSLRIDRALVEVKLKRVDAALRSSTRGAAELQGLRDRSSAALQEFMDGDYAKANRQLNAILRALAR
jgi:eukaryotic-like serine/threonine-protein kinase